MINYDIWGPGYALLYGNCLFICFFFSRYFDFQGPREIQIKNSLFKQETDIIKVVTSTNGPFWAPLSNLYVRSILKVWNKVRSRKKVSYTWWRHFITNTSRISNYIFVWNCAEAFWIWRFGGSGKLNMKSSSNLSAAFHLPFPFSKKCSNNRWHIYGTNHKPTSDKFRSSRFSF